ncbi:zinc metalloprotease ZmpB isoform X2 [Sebastes umbrosus]|uniref:zinc metalloprotease ZmpB isoform X2 n=1 Tax=Sebastes umbrosus TaxID=72105 RepID=UPI0018A03D30|nr:zinc metalloprotease ZmpB isoform X2 [Sebastes umbrosus]
MSKGADKIKVFKTTRVRTTLKSDGFWIQKLKHEDEEQDKARTEHVLETRPSPVRQNSYVLSTAKMFESVDCPLSPPHHKTQFAPSEGDSANQANGEVIPPLKDAQPEGSTVETTDDAKPQAPTEELIQNDEAQPEKSVADNVEHNDGAAEVSAEIHVSECIQNGEAQPESSTKENPEAVPAEQPVANATAENKGEHADATVDQSNIEHNEANVSADVHVEDPVAESSSAVAEVPALPAVELTPQEEPATETEPANATHLEDAGVESTVKPEEGSCEACPPEQAAEEIVEAVAEVVAQSSPDTSDVVDATPGEEDALQDSVEAVADVAVVPETQEAALQDSVEAVAKVAVVPETQEAALQDSVEAVAEVAVVPETQEAALQDSVETVAELALVPETQEAALQDSIEAVAEVAVVPETQEAALQDSVEDVAEVAVAPEMPAVTGAAGEEAATQVSVESVPDLVAEIVSELPTQTATETAAEGSCETGPPEQAAEEVVEAVAEVAVESAPETPAVTGAAGEEDALRVSVEPVPDLVADTMSESPPQAAAAETTVEPVECEVVSTVSAETVIETRAEEVVECEVQSVDNAAVEQSVEPTPERAADGVVKIEDAVEAVTASDAETVQFSDRPIGLSEALDVELPTTEAAPEPLENPKQSPTEETRLITEHSDTNISDMLQKYKEELQSNLTPGITWKKTRNRNVCSFCDKIIDGNVKIHLSDPEVTCHPDCLKCGVCAKALGDMLTPMFFHGQLVQCGCCFVKTLT